MSDIEHHWHNPTQGQVSKAVYQYLADSGVTRDILADSVSRKIAEAISGAVDRAIKSGRFDELLLTAVLSYVQNEKTIFNREGGYGLSNRLRDIIQKELAAILVKDYQVSVTKRNDP